MRKNSTIDNLFGIPVLISHYAPPDTIILIGKKKRPYSPIPDSVVDVLLGPFNEWSNQVMGVIKLKPTNEDKDSWISKNHTLTQIRGREEAIEYFKQTILTNGNV